MFFIMCDKYGVILERFKEYARNYTREEIAKGINCDTSLVTKHFNGDRSITIDYAIKYAKFFNITVDYLVGLSDVATPDTDMLAISKYTGLNGQTISFLHDWVERKETIPNFDILMKKLDVAAMFNLMCADERFIKMFCPNFLNYLDDNKINNMKMQLFNKGEIMFGTDVSTIFLMNMQQNIVKFKADNFPNGYPVNSFYFKESEENADDNKTE